MQRFERVVWIETDTGEHADAVLASRLYYDEPVEDEETGAFIEYSIGEPGSFGKPKETKAEGLPDSLRAEIRAALSGDSNDAEHDALSSVADLFGIEWTACDDVLGGGDA